MTDLINTADLTTPAAQLAKRSNTSKIAKVILTDKGIAKLKKHPAPAGQRYTVWDALVPGFGVRVTDKGHLSFVLAGRYPGSKHYTRRDIGEVGAIDLAPARDQARAWIEQMQAGKDPRAEQERLARDEARKAAHTFAQVAEDFIAERVVGKNPERPIQRKAKYVQRILRDVFIKTWGERPIADIDRGEVLTLIKAKVRTAPAEARSQLAILKSLFSWALDSSYGLDRSICSDIKPKNVFGERTDRERKLTDDEVRALWTVANQWRGTQAPSNAAHGQWSNYPVGPVYKMLLLSGLRLNEVCQASWSEFDWAKGEWIIPAARMKGKNVGSGGKKARDHLVPLTAPMIEILNSLPRFTQGDFCFSTTKGRKQIWLGSQVKNAIDDAMLAQLRVIAQERGNDPKTIVSFADPRVARLRPGEIAEWVNHDIRRTVRSNLSALKVVKEEVAEAILAHAKRGIVGTYNVHQYADEKREALELWAARLHAIVNPPQPAPVDSNVVNLKKARR
jgi:integrase